MTDDLRMGMWVKVGSQVGIVTSLDPVRVDLVNDAGETTGTVDSGKAKQAGRMDIPAARRPKAEHAKRLGYA